MPRPVWCIKHGDWVRAVEPSRIDTRGRAYLTEGVRPGVVMMERFYFPESYDKSHEEHQRAAGASAT